MGTASKALLLALSERESTFQEDHFFKLPSEERAVLHMELAKDWAEAERDKQALHQYQLAKEALAASDTPNHETQLRICFAMATLYRQQGDYRVAQQSYKEALAISEAHHVSAFHEDTGICHLKLAQLSEAIWRLAPALSHYELAFKHFEQAAGASHPHTVQVKQLWDAAIEKDRANKAEKQVAS